MIELANAIKEIGLVAVLAAAVVFLLYLVIKWLLGQMTKDREAYDRAVMKFTDVIAESSKILSLLASVIAETKNILCSVDSEARGHHELAASAFSRIREEHEAIKDKIDEANNRINTLRSAMIDKKGN